MGDAKLDFRNVGVKRWRTMCLGQNRMGMCHEGNQGQTEKSCNAKEEEMETKFKSVA
jgi:hypothetical protein